MTSTFLFIILVLFIRDAADFHRIYAANIAN